MIRSHLGPCSPHPFKYILFTSWFLFLFYKEQDIFTLFSMNGFEVWSLKGCIIKTDTAALFILFVLKYIIISVVVQFYPWLNFYFPLCLCMVINDTEHKKMETKIEPTIKWNQNMYTMKIIKLKIHFVCMQVFMFLEKSSQTIIKIGAVNYKQYHLVNEYWYDKRHHQKTQSQLAMMSYKKHPNGTYQCIM